ncbi:MAG: biopolymer transporter ExbD [Deltaproteobacteria bacterium]|nr:biopolymer transporter ExbD [Deltaproteobacteria bacterium]MBI2974522.1 biopolymer transporter ExbD [Deltaproteobacteria bacterium]
MKFNSTHNKELSEINVIPFCDILLVLLIIFMITAPLMQQGLDVNLPQAAAPSLSREKTDIVLTMHKNGSMFIGDDPTPVTMGFLEKKLGDVYKEKEKKDLFIKADTDILYGEVVKVMSLAKSAGVLRIGMVTQPEKEKR